MIGRSTQRGGVLLMALAALMLAGLGFMLIDAANPEARLRAQDEATHAALAQAKEALLGYAATTPMGNRGTGNLLCPDLNNDGIAYSAGNGCSGAANQARRIGRVPWRTLGVPEVRDGSGERLWYAVSDNFRSHQPATSNSDTSGTLSIRDASGRLIHDASLGAGVAAVILAPGPPLTRPRLQSRPGNSAADYLDTALGEDNAGFIDATANGFIMGPVRAADGSLIANDRLVVITRDELLAAIEKRFAGEVRNCLLGWAEHNNDQFPPPVPLENTDDLGIEGALFGRVPQKIPRDHAQMLSLAITQLDAARSQFASATTDTRRTATLALSHAHKSLISATSATATTAPLLKTSSGAALINQITATGIDALVPTSTPPAPASTVALDANFQSAIAAAYDALALSASQTVTQSTAATKTADTVLKTPTASAIATLTTQTENALAYARTLALANRTAQVSMVWPTTPDCSFMDPTKNSAWVANQWRRHLYYQTDQRNLIRDSQGNLAAGGLSVNDRGGYQLVVIAAGRALGSQNRTTATPAQFFEGRNAHASRSSGALAPSKLFEQRALHEQFNDQLAY